MTIQINENMTSASNQAAKEQADAAKKLQSKEVFNALAAEKAHKDEVAFEPTSRVAEAYRSLSVSEHYQYSETMTLNLTTKEGDKVSIDYRQLYAQYQSRSEFENVQTRPEGITFFNSTQQLEATQFEEHFGFSVEGHLNEQELQAIYDVFAKVDDLANHFYAGDIEKAFEKAQELNIDFNQIGSLNVNMTQTELKAVQYQQAAMAEYARAQRDSKAQDENAHEHIAQVGELPDYLQKWQAALEKLDAFFENSDNAVTELTAGIAAQRFGEQDSQQGWFERVSKLHEQLNDELKQVQEQVVETPLDSDFSAVEPRFQTVV